MSVDLLLGLQWGDEGKGKIVDVLTNSYDIIARFQGGPNAGHTLEFNGNKHVLHTIPSGIFHKNKINVIGNGVVIDPTIFEKEIKGLNKYSLELNKTLLISKKAHLILPTHRILDAASELSKGKFKIGSTLKGIGPAYMDKTGRNGIRVGDIISSDWEKKYNSLLKKHLNILKNYKNLPDYDLKLMEKAFFKGIEMLKKFNLIDSEQYLYEESSKGKNILAEGAQGSMLDIDFGTYPFVTSSTTTAAGLGDTGGDYYYVDGTYTGTAAGVAFVVGNGDIDSSNGGRGANSSNAFIVNYDGSATLGGDLTVNSDARLKSNIISLGSTLSKLLLIDGKSYTMKANESIAKIGLLAQEVQQAFPELVKTANDQDGTMSVNYQGMIPVLINAIKEQQKQIEELKAMIEK